MVRQRCCPELPPEEPDKRVFPVRTNPAPDPATLSFVARVSVAPAVEDADVSIVIDPVAVLIAFPFMSKGRKELFSLSAPFSRITRDDVPFTHE
jgi:hypothetical protein